MKTALIVILTIVAALVIPFLLPASAPTIGDAEEHNLPWKIAVHTDGSTQVFGLSPGISTLTDARERLAQVPEIAIIGLRDQAGSLEAFFDSVRLGPLTGKLIVTAKVSDELAAAMRQRAIKTDHMDSAMLRSTLTQSDKAQAMLLPIHAIVFVPAARLDESIIVARFGAPVERRKSDDEVQHFLYPALGLDIALNAKGKAQLQYVAPKDFAQLLTPLTQDSNSPRADSKTP